MDKAQLLANMLKSFTAEELNTLCWMLGADPEEIGGQTKQARTRTMIDYFEKRGRLPDLVARCAADRPRVPWGEVASAESLMHNASAPPALDISRCFAGLSTFQDKKDFCVHPLEMRISEGRFDLSDTQMQTCATSTWEFDRIALYLLNEQNSNPGAKARIRHVEHEFSLVRNSPGARSLMPLHYALRSLVRWLVKCKRPASDLASSERLFEDLLSYLEAREYLDRGGEVKANLHQIIDYCSGSGAIATRHGSPDA